MDKKPLIEQQTGEIQTSRRRLLKALALGGTASVVLPEKWVKPVVDAVIVPAHAQGSITVFNGIYANHTTYVTGLNSPAKLMDRFAGLFVSSANAAFPNTCSTLLDVDCIAFDFAYTPNVAVYLVESGNPYSAPTTAHPNNSVDDVTIGSYAFTNLVVSSTLLVGNVAGNACSTSSFSLPLEISHGCNPPPPPAPPPF